MELLNRPKQNSFPDVLKDWRHRRRFSQLELSLTAGISQRHISFLETGRSQPSRMIISRLAEVLEMPAAEVDAMLLSAGFASPSAQSSWDAQVQSAVTQSIEHILTSHNPYPAITVDRIWNLKNANESAQNFLGPFMQDENPNILREFLRPGALREALTNWDEIATAFIRFLELELTHRPNNAEGHALLSELKTYYTAGQAAKLAATEYPPPVLTMKFCIGGETLQFFSMIAAIGMTASAALDDILIETMLPANDATRSWFTAPHRP